MKKIMKIMSRVLSVCLLVLLMPITSFAAPGDMETSLTMTYPLNNTEFSFYKVADFSETGIFVSAASSR